MCREVEAEVEGERVFRGDMPAHTRIHKSSRRHMFSGSTIKIILLESYILETIIGVKNTMSVTTTDNPITLSLRQTLGDYEVHVSGDSADGGEITSPNTSNQRPAVENPSFWPQDHHRIPNYRPINRNLSYAQRPNGTVLPEQIFLTFMFTGVALNAVGGLLIVTKDVLHD